MRDEKEQYYWDLIASRISGNISPDEEYVLSRWMNNAEANRKKYEEAVELWKSTQQKKPMAEDAVDIDKEWQLFQQKASASTPGEKGRVRYLSVPSVRLAIAASISAVVLTLFIVWQQTANSWLTYQASTEVLTITLPDSSTVWLNQNSRLRVKEDFSQRQVQLSGEGYFLVKRNESSPFVVETTQGLVTVLGTSFNVNSTDTSSIVSVLSGKVRVEDRADQQQELNALDQATLNSQGVQTERISTTTFTDWRLVNNPQYAKERTNKLSFLSVEYTWKKNAVNSSVLKGAIVNTATLVEYDEILLEVQYKRPNGKVVKSNLLLRETVKPGSRLDFTNRLFDIFSKTEDVTVKIVSASVHH